MHQSFLNYLNQVLGIRFVPRPSVTHQIKMTFISEMELHKAEIDLVTKISKALNLEAAEWVLVHGNWANQIDTIEKSIHAVCFSESLFENLQTNFPQLNLVHVPSPSEMIANPSLKRLTWETLKRLNT